jgi:hypothetical protein
MGNRPHTIIESAVEAAGSRIATLEARVERLEAAHRAVRERLQRGLDADGWTPYADDAVAIIDGVLGGGES